MRLSIPLAPPIHLLLPGLLLAISCVLAWAGLAWSGIVVQHSGQASPLAEGWVEAGDGTGITVGPLIDGGVEGWFVQDQSISLGSTRSYRHVLTQAEADSALNYGWILRAHLRVLEPQAVDQSTSVNFHLGPTVWSLAFGATSVGGQIVQSVSGVCGNTCYLGPTHASGGGYHLYELQYNPSTGLASLAVDGVGQIPSIPGMTDVGTPAVSWGSGSSHGVGHANFSLIEYEILGPTGQVGIDDDVGLNPQPKSLLAPSTPNPFRSRSEISFTTYVEGTATLDVFDHTGRLVTRLFGQTMPPGTVNLSWGGRDSNGLRVPAGIYFYRLTTPVGSSTQRTLFLR